MYVAGFGESLEVSDMLGVGCVQVGVIVMEVAPWMGR